jgi:UDP-N-acetylglucosamine:LPS N-acetylglucosamine transferase
MQLCRRDTNNWAAARLALEPALNPERLAGALAAVIASPEHLAAMEAALKKLPRENTAARIVDLFSRFAER